MDPLEELDRGSAAIRYVYERSSERLELLPQLSAHGIQVQESGFRRFALPEQGIGSFQSTLHLWNLCSLYASNTTGPRFLDFVIGGVTPAALAGDWIASVFDQNVAGRVTGALATDIELMVLDWMKKLLGVPDNFHGTMVPSATYANFSGLSCARQWFGESYGVDVTLDGVDTLPPFSILGSSFVHSSVEKALQMLGMGRNRLQRFDLVSSRDGLKQLQGKLESSAGPTIIAASAGEVNGGRFDPLNELADLADHYGAWLHVDAAFGIHAAFHPSLRRHLEGIDRAASIGADMHKWLNVPYDSGFFLVKDKALLRRTFGMPEAPYIQDLASDDAGLASWGPDASRRARALPVLSTLMAYGRAGIQEMIDRQMRAMSVLVGLIDSSHHFEIITESLLPIVCFRAVAGDDRDVNLDEMNSKVAADLNSEGRFAVGTTEVDGNRALRVALLNWAINDDIIYELFENLNRSYYHVIARMRDEGPNAI